MAHEYEPQLVQAGLSREQALAYETLVEKGSLPASDAARLSGISRTLGYKVLGELEALGLVEKNDPPGKVATFRAAHPLKLKEFVERREREAKDARTVVESIVGPLSSAFNLAGGKPGVEFFEGLEGIQTVLDDSLKSKTEIFSYADLESIEKYIAGINREYVRERERRHIVKKGIVVDTPFARNFLKGYAPGVTETKLIAQQALPHHTVMQIYDGKISYCTLSEENILGILIDDKRIYEMHCGLFRYLWNSLPALTPE